MSFLETSQKHLWKATNDLKPSINAKDKRVIVVGGGDTGCDCIGTSLRQVIQMHFRLIIRFYSLSLTFI
jgi:NADPH-dependent glutamate synthase beta subunit-like oxidoreductase